MNLLNYQYVEIGDVFPIINPQPHVRYVNAILNEKFIDVAIFIPSPSKEEIDTINKKDFLLFSINLSQIPIIIADFGNGFQFHVPLNVFTFGSKEEIENWLESDCEPIKLLLIDGDSNILHVFRSISINTSEIKEVLKMQYRQYKSVEEVENEIESLFSQTSRQELIDLMKKNLIKKQK